MPKKLCVQCNGTAYTVHGFWSQDETYYVCDGCNKNEEECPCPPKVVNL